MQWPQVTVLDSAPGSSTAAGRSDGSDSDVGGPGHRHARGPGRDQLQRDLNPAGPASCHRQAAAGAAAAVAPGRAWWRVWTRASRSVRCPHMTYQTFRCEKKEWLPAASACHPDTRHVPSRWVWVFSLCRLKCQHLASCTRARPTQIRDSTRIT